MFTPRVLAFAALRATVGVVFLFFGIGKFSLGLAASAAGIEQMFAKTWLPPAGTHTFAVILPFLEVTIGALLVAGLFTRLALLAAALLMVFLTAGLAVAALSQGVALNMVYALALYFLLTHVADDNRISLDALLGL